MPNVEISWDKFGDSIIRAAQSLYVSSMRWGMRFNQHFYQYYNRHVQFSNKTQQSIDNWYFQNMADTINYLSATRMWPKAAIEGLEYTVAWSAGSTGNRLNLMGWYVIDVAHATYSATFK